MRIEVELAKDVDEMFKRLSLYLYTQPHDESWLVFLPTRRLVEKYAGSYGGVYIHGGLEGSEINKIQARAEMDKNLRIFATNVIASSVNIYVDNVLIFNEVIDGKDKLGQKTLHYKKIDNNSLLQMIGRIGRFKPGRAVIISDTPIPKKIDPDARAQGARDRDAVRPRPPDVEVRPQALGPRVHVEGGPPRGRLRRGLARSRSGR